MKTLDQIPAFITTQLSKNQPVSLKSCLFISSSAKSISRFDKFIIGMQTTWKLKQEIFDNIRIVLHEALMNAVVHGNKSRTGRLVYIEALRNSDFCIFSIEDEGSGFNSETLENPVSSENLTKQNGRGIFIMKHLADAVHFSKNGACVKLLFRSE